MDLKVKEALEFLSKEIKNPEQGLGEELFYFVSSLTPMINVELLLKDSNKRTLLSWRDDEYNGKGWHLPGRVIRFKETINECITKLFLEELSVDINVRAKLEPIQIGEVILPERSIRGHFIGLLYTCTMENYIPENKDLKEIDKGYLKWFDKCPDNFLECQNRLYRKYI